MKSWPWLVFIAFLLTACGGPGSSAPGSGPGSSAPLENARASIDSVGQVSNPDTPTFTFGALALESEAPTLALESEATTRSALESARWENALAQVPYANQTADNCVDTGHCSHATLLMAAAALNPSILQRKISQCSGPVGSVLSPDCVAAAQREIEFDPSRSDITVPLTRMQCGSFTKGGTLMQACGCGLTPDTSAHIAQSRFGLKAAVLTNARSQNDSDEAALKYTRTTLKNVLDADCLAGINVQAQDKDDANAGKMSRHRFVGHWMLLVGEITDGVGRASSYLINDPFHPKGSQSSSGAGVAYKADSVLDLVVSWNRSERGRNNTIVAFCPPDGPRLLINQFVFPKLAVNEPTDGLRLGSHPDGASFELKSGALPPGLELSADGKITGIPSAIGTYPFTATATYRFQSSALIGKATTAFEIVVVEDSGPLHVSFLGDLGVAIVGEVVERYLPNWVNKKVTWTIEGGGGAAQIVGDKLVVAVHSANDILFNLVAATIGLIAPRNSSDPVSTFRANSTSTRGGERVSVSTRMRVSTAPPPSTPPPDNYINDARGPSCVI